MRFHLWSGYLAAEAVVLGGYLFLPAGLPRDVVYLLVGLSSVSAIGFGMRRNAPARRLPWRLIMFGQLLWVAGDTFGSWSTDIAHLSAYPSPADACYLSAYPLIALGLAAMIRGRLPRRDFAGLLDSFTLTAGLGLVSWMLLARPTLAASQQSIPTAVVGLTYPFADIVLAGLLIRLVTTSGARTPAYRWLCAGVALLVAGDTASSALSLWSTSNGNFDLFWLASYVAWGVAALHPSMTSVSEPVADHATAFSPRRLAALTVASLTAPATLAVEAALGVRIDAWAIVIGSVVLFLLVVSRMTVAIRQIEATSLERDRLQHNLAFQAAHDALTELPNRAQALNSIEAALNRAQRTGGLIGLLFIDLDGFKAVNDVYGHRAGDEVLRVTAARLKEAVRGGDLVARLGGDEFVILLEVLACEADAVTVATRVVKSVAVPSPIGTHARVSVGASVGIAISQDGSTDAQRLLHEADTAAYRAKAAGRGRVEVFDNALRLELAARADLEAALVDAITNDELVVHYQPIFDLQSGRTTGYEALVRWERPGHGLIQPNDFIPTAEGSSLICDLDTWVLNAATAQLATWIRQGAPSLTIAVNISGRHLCEPRIVDDVRTALSRSGLDPASLVLEITETVLIEELLAVPHLHRIRELGVSISIDDFGTGYNSITRLQHLPIDIIKIDRSFLDMDDEYSPALLHLIIQTAHAFGLPVIAEGVENQQQRDLLDELKCESAQGFYLSRPLSAAAVRRSAAFRTASVPATAHRP